MSERIIFQPRPWQQAIMEGDWLRCWIEAHRRSGKTTLLCALAVAMAWLNRDHKDKQWICDYLMPYHKQIRRQVWGPMTKMASSLPGTTINKSHYEIHFGRGAGGKNDAVIRTGGVVHDPDAWRGDYLHLLILDELADLPVNFYELVVRPQVEERGGVTILSGTPRGPDSHFKTMSDYARHHPAEWRWECLKASESGILAPTMLHQQQASMEPHLYRQEYEMDHNVLVPGAFYQDTLSMAREDNRIGIYPHDPQFPVSWALDLGYSDDTAGVAWQQTYDGIRFVDCFEDSEKQVPHYVSHIISRGHRLDRVWLPHDGKNIHLGQNRSVFRQFAAALADKAEVRLLRRPKHNINKVQAVRQVMQTAHIHEPKCAVLLGRMAQYRREWDAERKCFKSEEPAPRQPENHMNDAMAYACMAITDLQRERPVADTEERAWAAENLGTPGGTTPILIDPAQAKYDPATRRAIDSTRDLRKLAAKTRERAAQM